MYNEMFKIDQYNPIKKKLINGWDYMEYFHI